MNTRVIHTPEGVRDIYGSECREKRQLMAAIRAVFEGYGCSEIATPTIEYFDVFSSDIGTTASRELFKFFDRDGNTLVLRPDFTPSVARAVSMHVPPEAMPVRLCYEGSTFRNNAEYQYQGRLKEATQMGVEFIGDGSYEADAEVIALTVEMLLSAGLKELQVSVGEVDFFKALVEDSGLEEEAVEELRRLISNKNFFGVEELLAGKALEEERAAALSRLPRLFGNEDILDEAAALTGNERAKSAIARLRRINRLLAKKGLDKYVSYDFGLLSKYRYYTGIIFSAFTYGVGEPVARGGRYDNLLGNFGHDYPAVGMGLYLDQLMNALHRQGLGLKA